MVHSGALLLGEKMDTEPTGELDELQPACYDRLEDYMPEPIDFKAMNEHDLLVMSVMQGNETVKQLEKMNSSIKHHERRITILETITTRPVNLTKKQAVGIGGSVFILGAFWAGVINALGQIVGLW